jgi:hypothetical protein
MQNMCVAPPVMLLAWWGMARLHLGTASSELLLTHVSWHWHKAFHLSRSDPTALSTVLVLTWLVEPGG